MEYTLHFHDGHPIIHTEQDHILIDIGSPTSFHDHGHLPFMGQEFQAEQAQLGGDMYPLRQMTGVDITSLMGMDIMRRFSVEFRYAEGKVIFDTAPLLLREVSLQADLVMGISIIPVDVCNSRRRMYLDTGAKLSYLDSRNTHGRTPDATDQDFYPGIGHFQPPYLP